ncbi:hypothetical protein F8388_020902 [Cannabis sativa]|uniref:Uncharacterized protein n=1 Tax=Cannabis sativa TaxID=3483 RepID=A0A7J6FKM2_CANSA|nr:hypothetical protein F8388_020902 [Cannabis sativa]
MENMYLSKGVIVAICIINLIGCSNVELIDGRIIGYGTITRDEIAGCSFKHPQNCMKNRHSDNTYQRGCIEEDHCRDHDPPPTPI